jgi:hypothetical protein
MASEFQKREILPRSDHSPNEPLRYMLKTLRSNRLISLLPISLSLLGGLAYLLIAYGHIHGQVSVLDEGLYLVKGYLFASGVYRPFQDFGPLTNHMPLSFLIPGWVQLIFKPGIATGRTFAVVLGLLMLSGLWLITARITSKWWATLGVWLIVINPALMKIYSQAVSQVLVASILMWVVFFALVEGRWHRYILVGVLLAGILSFTRINLFPVLPLVVVYVFWKFDRKWGIASLLLAITVVALGHALFWPNILKLWAKWLPTGVTPFLDNYRLPLDAIPLWDPPIRFDHRVDSLLVSIRYHLVSILGVIGSLILLLSLRSSRNNAQSLKPIWFLTILYLGLFTLHGFASLGLDYCVYCFRSYIAFFAPIGSVLFIWLCSELLRRARPAYIWFGALFSVPFLLGMPLGSGLGNALLATDVPRISGMRLLPGTLELNLLVGNKLGLGLDAQTRVVNLLILIALLFLPALVVAIARHQKEDLSSSGRVDPLRRGIMALIILELGLATIFFGNQYQDYDCGNDMIAAHEEVGQYLAMKIPPGNRVYWGVEQSPTPLLYLQGRTIYPAQLNGDYTFMLAGGSTEINRLGYWDTPLASNWMHEADYVLVSERDYGQLFTLGFEDDMFDEIERTQAVNPCLPSSSIMIFKRQ